MSQFKENLTFIFCNYNCEQNQFLKVSPNFVRMKYATILLSLSLAFSACQNGEKKSNDNNNQKEFIQPPKHSKDTGQVYLIFPNRKSLENT